MLLVVIASVWKQITTTSSSSSRACSRSRSRSSRRPRSTARAVPALLDDRLPAAVATTFFLLVMNIIYSFFDTFA